MSTLCNPWTAAFQAFLSITNSQSLLKLTFIESVMPSSHLCKARGVTGFPTWCSAGVPGEAQAKWTPTAVVPFSSCPQSLPASKSFPMSQLSTWGGQSTGASVLPSFLPKKSQGWSPSEWTSWISLQSKGTLKSLLQQHSSKASILRCSGFFIVQLSHPYMTTVNHSLD